MALAASTAFQTVQGLLFTQVHTVWVTTLTLDEDLIFWPQYKPSVNGGNPPSTGNWLDVHLDFGGAAGHTLGGPGVGENRRFGMLFLLIRGQKTDGTAGLMAIASRFSAHFRRVYYGEVYCQVDSGPVDISDDSHATIQLGIGFWYLEKAG